MRSHLNEPRAGHPLGAQSPYPSRHSSRPKSGQTHWRLVKQTLWYEDFVCYPARGAVQAASYLLSPRAHTIATTGSTGSLDLAFVLHENVKAGTYSGLGNRLPQKARKIASQNLPDARLLQRPVT